jgi:exopolysaccharide biosynthesis protein
VVVEGKLPGESVGFSLNQLSQLFFSLGCKSAFDLDGGGSSQMAFLGNLVNKPSSDYRKVPDMIYITDIP